jgi:hypothetical protein
MGKFKEPSIYKGAAVLGAIILTVVLAIIKAYEYCKDIFNYITENV